MKIAFILPAIGKKQNEKYIGTWKMEPLMMAVLKALTPLEVETVFFDDRIELIPEEIEADVVAITVETYTARRAYQLAGRFRKQGKTIILGGYHVTTLPEEAQAYGDAILIGNAETVWPQLIADLYNNQLKSVYHGHSGFQPIQPDKSLYKGKKYIPMSLVETGRGCCHGCEFCSIASYYQSRYHLRDIDEIVKEIKESAHQYFFFVDDNIVANKEYAMKLFDAIEKLNIKWSGQGTITMATDKELLRKMRKSGCEVILIGFESLDSENLKQMNKSWSMKLGNMDQLVRNIHQAGISIYATFLLGFDNDGPDTVKEMMAFSKKHQFFFAAFNHLLPFPGTPLYERLKKEGRLFYDQWWLEDDYIYGDISYKPKKMEPEALSKMCEDARKDFYRLPSVIDRFFALLKRNRSLFLLGIFLAFNLQLGEEVGQKMRIPIGRGLDEMPK